MQVQQLEKEKKTLSQKLTIASKRIDHVERAFRKEEIPLISQDYERQQARDREAFESAQVQRAESSKAKHVEGLAIKAALQRILPDFASFREKREKESRTAFENEQRRLREQLQEEKEERRRQVLEEIEQERLAAIEREKQEALDRERAEGAFSFLLLSAFDTDPFLPSYSQSKPRSTPRRTPASPRSKLASKSAVVRWRPKPKSSASASQRSVSPSARPTRSASPPRAVASRRLSTAVKEEDSVPPLELPPPLVPSFPVPPPGGPSATPPPRPLPPLLRRRSALGSTSSRGPLPSRPRPLPSLLPSRLPPPLLSLPPRLVVPSSVLEEDGASVRQPVSPREELPPLLPPRRRPVLPLPALLLPLLPPPPLLPPLAGTFPAKVSGLRTVVPPVLRDRRRRAVMSVRGRLLLEGGTSLLRRGVEPLRGGGTECEESSL